MAPTDGSPIYDFTLGINFFIPSEKKFQFQGRVYDRTIYLSFAVGGPVMADSEVEIRSEKKHMSMSILCACGFGCKLLGLI